MFAWFKLAEPHLVHAQLLFAMFGMGLTLKFEDFLAVFKDPRGLAIGLGLQLGLIPVLAVIFNQVFQLGPGWAIGLLLVAVVPGGAFSNLLTFLGKGNVPLSIAVTTCSTLGCIVTVPLLLRLWAGSYLPESFHFPAAKITQDIFLYLIIPLAAGMAIFRKWPKPSPKLSKYSVRASMLLVGVLTVGALGAKRIPVAAYGWVPPLRIVAFGILISLAVPQLCRLFRRTDEDCVALSIEVCVRNVGVALLLMQFFFPGKPEQGHALYTCLFYAGISMWLTIPAILLNRAGKSVVLFRKRVPAVAEAPQETASEV